MSSVLVEYPEGLPAPTTGEVRPTERRAISSVGQMRNMRAIQRDRHGTRTVAFTFTPDQASIFREWWVEWLQLGGGWFAANWPLPWSRGPNVFRFTDPPQWQLIGGRLDGQGYWQVRGTCEIRGRGMLPTAEVMYLTSTPYPLEVFEQAQVCNTVANSGELRTLPTAAIGDTAIISSATVTGGTLRDSLQVAFIGPENTFVALQMSSGDLREILKSYKFEIESVNITQAAPTSGTLQTLLIQYTNWPIEPATISSVTVTGGTLT